MSKSFNFLIRVFWVLIILSILSFAYNEPKADIIKTETRYEYQYDNQGYVNHQIDEIASYKSYGMNYQHNETNDKTDFFYDKVLFTKKFSYLADIKLGVGTIYGSGFSLPAYVVNINKFNTEFNFERNAVANSVVQSGNNGNSKNYRDDISLSHDFIFDKYTFVLGGTLGVYDNDNISKTLLFKNIYQINDNFNIQNVNKYTFTDRTDINYFSPRNYDYNRLLLGYNYNINEDFVLKALAGLSIVAINQRRELVPYYELKAVYNSKIAKFDAGYKCNETINEYRYCAISGGVKVNF